MQFDFNGKVVIVTGAGAGIGEAIAKLFAENGACVIVNSKTSAHCKSVADSICQEGYKALAVAGDVSEVDVVNTLVETAEKEFGGLDIVVNNAGIVVPGTSDTQTIESFDASMKTNVRSTFMLTQKSLPLLRKRGGGSIVNIASIAGLKGTKNRIAYSASKGAVISMSRSMALELAPENIRINVICPGMTKTPSLEQRILASPDPVKAERDFLAAIPAGRFGRPDDMASLALFLCSEYSPFTTGAVITVDGAKSL